MSNAPPTGWETLIIILPSILAFLTASLAAVLAHFARATAALTQQKVADLHILLNSRLDLSVDATRRGARAEGLIAGAADERKRVADLPQSQAGFAAGVVAGTVDERKRVADLLLAAAVVADQHDELPKAGA
jgi:hypothetical protein